MAKSGIIFSPVVSEKSFRLAAARQYTFRVDPRATAPAIAAAIAQLYSVNVIGLRTANRLGKLTSHKGRSGSRSSEKRAIVTLKVGDRITGFEVETPKPEKTAKPAIKRPSDTVEARAEGTNKQSGVTTTVRSPKAAKSSTKETQ